MIRNRAPQRLAVLLLFVLARSSSAQPVPAVPPSEEAAPWPKVLLVTAHPDDDALFGGTVYKVGHYVRYPSGTAVSAAECMHIKQPIKAMCTNLSTRLACADNFRL